MTANAEAVGSTPAEEPAALAATRAFLLGLGALVAVAALFYFTSAHLSQATSDSATIALEGQSMAAGHLLLHGWDLTFASYWTSAALLDAILIALGGLRASVLYLGPALDAAAVVILGALLSGTGRRGVPGAAGAAAVASLLCLGVPVMEFFLVGHGFHVGTVAYALAAFVALRKPTHWRWALAVLCVAAGVLGDLLMLAWGPLPLLVAGIAGPAGDRGARRTRRPEVTAALAGVALAVVVRLVLVAAGAYVAGSGLAPAKPAQMLRNLAHLPAYTASLLGLGNAVARSGGIPAGVPSTGALGIFDALGAVVVLVCFLVALVGFVRRLARSRLGRPVAASGQGTFWIDDLLVVAVVCSVVPFLLLAEPRGSGIRYLVATVAFAAVLTGRMLSRALRSLASATARRLVLAAAAALVLGLAASFAESVSGPRPSDPAASLALWLEAHDLHAGIGDYWTAAITTVQSGGAVAVRPVLGHDGRIERRDSLSAAQWYERTRFQFLVYGPSVTFGVGLRSAVATFGPPEHVWRVGRYHVAVWGHDLTVSSRGTG